MSLGAKLATQLPYLRRYARALTGSQNTGDSFVRAVLEAALADPALKARLAEGDRVELYAAFNTVWASAYLQVANDDDIPEGHEASVRRRFDAMTPLDRQALLLTTLENFSSAEAGRIMGLTTDEVDALVDEAIATIDRGSKTEVLIIEDEPLISMQLEDLVRALGHGVCGTAATRSQALDIVAERRPGLVLADIQLADGSSGLDAADDILSITSVPVIFITAYPERLLTGDRPEPTYLVTKPFHEAAVRAAISQALFFGPSGPVQ